MGISFYPDLLLGFRVLKRERKVKSLLNFPGKHENVLLDARLSLSKRERERESE